jgi:acyl carrier protein
MKPTQPEVLSYVLSTVQGLCQDWDYADPVGPESLLFTGLGMESLDAVVLCTAIQEHYQTTMPFAELLAEIGQNQRDLSIMELAEFAYQHLKPVAEVEALGQEAVDAHPR